MYEIKFTFTHKGQRYRRGAQVSFSNDDAKDLIRQKLIRPCEVKKKNIDKPFVLLAEEVLQPTIAPEPKIGKKPRPKLGLSSQQTQAIE